MSHTSLTTQFSLTSSTSLGLILEQAEWDGIGKVTKLDLVKAMNTMLFGTVNNNEINCGVDGEGKYISGLYVYPFNMNLAYDIGITHGELGIKLVQEVHVRELVKFSLTKEQSAKYPVHSLTSYEWGADCWDGEGNVVTRPSISVDGQKILISNKVYGTVIIEYKTYRHARTLKVPPRENESINIYDSYAWARWNGGVELLKLEPPEGAEENYMFDIDCLGGGRGTVTPRDPPDRPTDSPEFKTVMIDYCTQQSYEFYV